MDDAPAYSEPADDDAHARRRRRRRLVGTTTALAVVAVSVVAGLSVSNDTEPVATPGAGQAPNFRLPDVSDPDREVALSDFGGRPVVLNFWASWCAPCRKEMPTLQSVHEATGNEVAFVGVNNSDARGPARALLEETGVTYPSGFDPGGSVFTDYQSVGMPTTVFISPEGRILGRHTGEIGERALLDALRRFFGVVVAQGAGR